jgi:DNA-binding transcriptional LysR family regulator
MSQSPLSRAIRELERELGLVLFVRATRRVELTPAGIVLLERARRGLVEIDGAIADARRAGARAPLEVARRRQTDARGVHSAS